MLLPRGAAWVAPGSELHSIDPSAGASLGTALARMGEHLLIGAPGEHGGKVIAARLRCEDAAACP
jgi:hypothetical protein